jgi:hypothetical protein
MVSEHELWACANFVTKTDRDRAPLFAAERIRALALDGDADGVAVWQSIAAKIEALTVPSGQFPPQ